VKLSLHFSSPYLFVNKASWSWHSWIGVWFRFWFPGQGLNAICLGQFCGYYYIYSLQANAWSFAKPTESTNLRRESQPFVLQGLDGLVISAVSSVYRHWEGIPFSTHKPPCSINAQTNSFPMVKRLMNDFAAQSCSGRDKPFCGTPNALKCSHRLPNIMWMKHNNHSKIVVCTFYWRPIVSMAWEITCVWFKGLFYPTFSIKHNKG